jgi:hypothetical protein
MSDRRLQARRISNAAASKFEFPAGLTDAADGDGSSVFSSLLSAAPAGNFYSIIKGKNIRGFF